MTRQTTGRDLYAEDGLARRLRALRTAAGWTYETAARRMEANGCRIDPNALYKIEVGEKGKRRQVTAPELVAFAKTYDLTLDELCTPPEIAASAEARRLIDAWQAAFGTVADAVDAENCAKRALDAFLNEHPEIADALEAERLAAISTLVRPSEQKIDLRFDGGVGSTGKHSEGADDRGPH